MASYNDFYQQLVSMGIFKLYQDHFISMVEIKPLVKSM